MICSATMVSTKPKGVSYICLRKIFLAADDYENAWRWFRELTALPADRRLSSSYAELDAVSVSKEEEKKILLALSQVFRQVLLWTQEFNSDTDNDSVLILDCACGCSSGSSPHFEETQCLTKIVADLVVLLTVQSKYVQHLASNVLVVSEYVAASGRNWDAFIHSLCACLDFAITIKLTFDSAHWPTGADDFNCGSSSFVLSLKQKLKDANWSAVASILRVLCTILKHFNPEDDVQLFTSYFDSVNSCLSNVPWDLFTQIFSTPNADAQKSSVADAVFHRSVFQGNFIQFFCSLVEQSGAVEAIVDSSKKRPDLSAQAIGMYLSQLVVFEFKILAEGRANTTWVEVVRNEAEYLKNWRLWPRTS
ncbi:hypothetical protein FNV43_RR20424 [Rhamnella rubrinervis]|uniref:Uncharacterized protein n=1 Tax=Rhamnella rubrinervis TaxID=2594499 RepID=A0A8K0GUK1_9ROSA|nr:hypothetical protein FNV43_RR20424 [Rhamnella rubrinervis]